MLGRGERSQEEGSDRRWRGAIAARGERPPHTHTTPTTLPFPRGADSEPLAAAAQGTGRRRRRRWNGTGRWTRPPGSTIDPAQTSGTSVHGLTQIQGGGGGAGRASPSGFYVYRPAGSAGSARKSTLPAGPSRCGPGRRMDAVRPAPGGLGARRPTARTALWNGRPGHLESVQTQPELRAAAIASGLLRIAASRAVGAFRVCRAAAQAAGGCLQVAVFLLPAGEADCLVHKGPSSQWGISSRPTAL